MLEHRWPQFETCRVLGAWLASAPDSVDVRKEVHKLAGSHLALLAH